MISLSYALLFQNYDYLVVAENWYQSTLTDAFYFVLSHVEK